ncbi:unnamed protein product [Polarella glacialis]|uniref:Uncharacterized protein n=1 Tax=Polarella glacialis TaxID=89957 RepID=A0A813FZS7_POLGL|nr:unnamed protein product [Polarella glacialis]
MATVAPITDAGAPTQCQMATVAGVAPITDAGALKQCQKVIAAIIIAGNADARCKTMHFMFFDKDGQECLSGGLEKTPPMFTKIAASKAKSFLEGRELKDPRGCSLMCCYVLPWTCGCTSQMPVTGVVSVRIPGTEVVGFVAAGAPTGELDLSLAKAALTTAGFQENAEGQWSPAE